MALPFPPTHPTATVFPLITVLATGCLLAAGGCDSNDSSGTASSTSTGTGMGGTSSTSTGGGTSTSTGTGGGSGGSIDCGPTPAGQAPALKLTEVANGLTRPLFVTGAPGDTSRLYVAEQGGRIKIVSGGAVLPVPFLDIDSLVIDTTGALDEYGFLGMAFHPGYAQNGRFFVFYIANNGDSVLAEYARSAGDPNVASPTAVGTLLTISGGGGQHYSGMLAFGGDGALYVGSGDRSTPGAAQTLSDQRGKILRLDVNNHPTPPPGNMPGADQYVWDYGVRNPWRMSFDRCSGDLYFGEVGGVFEEINVERAGQGHKNYGWPVVDTGIACDAGENCTGITLPFVEDDHGTSNCSFIGGYVYRGSAIPGMNGRYLYGDFCSNRIWSFVFTGNAIAQTEELTTKLLSTDLIQQLSSFGEDTAGNLYAVDLTGAVYRIDPG